MNTLSRDAEQFARDGFLMVQRVLPEVECDKLAERHSVLLEERIKTGEARIGGLRNLLSLDSRVAEVASDQKLLSLLKKLVDGNYFPVRVIFFDKTPENNWAAAWHQDLAIAVAERRDCAGFGGWSVKDGVVHVQPSAEILAGMITARIHLDNCARADGALLVLPGSHCQGKLKSEEIQRWSATQRPVICEARKGDTLLMRPLLLHSSGRAENPSHRRVLHIEYASHELPNGLDWSKQ